MRDLILIVIMFITTIFLFFEIMYTLRKEMIALEKKLTSSAEAKVLVEQGEKFVDNMEELLKEQNKICSIQI